MPRKRADSERSLRQNLRFGRLLRQLMLPGRGRAQGIDALAGELECSSRTVFRDVQALELASVPWWFDHDLQGYRLPTGWTFPALTATAEKRSTWQAPSDALRSHVGRLTAVLNSRSADVERTTESVETRQRALLNRRQVTGLYVSLYESKPKRLRLNPYRLGVVRHVRYVVGRATTD